MCSATQSLSPWWSVGLYNPETIQGDHPGAEDSFAASFSRWSGNTIFLVMMTMASESTLPVPVTSNHRCDKWSTKINLEAVGKDWPNWNKQPRCEAKIARMLVRKSFTRRTSQFATAPPSALISWWVCTGRKLRSHKLELSANCIEFELYFCPWLYS